MKGMMEAQPRVTAWAGASGRPRADRVVQSQMLGLPDNVLAQALPADSGRNALALHFCSPENIMISVSTSLASKQPF